MAENCVERNLRDLKMVQKIIHYEDVLEVYKQLEGKERLSELWINEEGIVFDESLVDDKLVGTNNAKYWAAVARGIYTAQCKTRSQQITGNIPVNIFRLWHNPGAEENAGFAEIVDRITHWAKNDLEAEEVIVEEDPTSKK